MKSGLRMVIPITLIALLTAALIAQVKLRSIVVNAGAPGFQRGAPLQILGYRVDQRDLLHTLYLFNASDRTVVYAQVGWLVENRLREGEGVPFLGPAFELNLPPGSYTSVGRHGANFSTAYQVLTGMGAEYGQATVGLVYAKFADGGQWSYPHALRRRFEIVDDPTLLERMRPALEEIKAKRKAEKAARLNASNRRFSTSLFTNLIEWLDQLLGVRKAYAANWFLLCNPGTMDCDCDLECESIRCDAPGSNCLQYCGVVPRH